MSTPTAPSRSANGIAAERLKIRADRLKAEEAAAARLEKERVEDSALRVAQTLKAKNVKLERLARKNHDIADLLEEYQALKITSEELARRLATLDSGHTGLAVEASRLQEENVEQRQKLVAADAARAELLKAAETSDAEFTQLKAELADLKKQLASALKPKKAE